MMRSNKLMNGDVEVVMSGFGFGFGFGPGHDFYCGFRESCDSGVDDVQDCGNVTHFGSVGVIFFHGYRADYDFDSVAYGADGNAQIASHPTTSITSIASQS
ncbi:hypothetical protein JM16_001418 [Phytophthora kernoviae]|uniref:Uncharacterized protein n=1 Tax=Phytophthora kernoviae TaxID=325452 RepID=A0A8T0M994_9STRA|nr:hypothetical protein JM16_001418 [Phytophthora kernoviae]